MKNWGKKVPLENFRRVDKTLYTSALPTKEKGIDFLLRNNFGAVVSIARMEPRLSKRLEAGGIKVHDFVGDYSFVTGLPIVWSGKVQGFFRIVAENELCGKRVLVHCYGGFHGAGFFSSMYKAVKGLPIEITEMPFLYHAEYLKKLYSQALVSAAKKLRILPSRPPRAILKWMKRHGKKVIVAKPIGRRRLK
ncbi:Uncharacterised protein [uncultured archaeon]|nr:Uncharacterised protein [uncultured archaeon]